jgi:hypothetical protein
VNGYDFFSLSLNGTNLALVPGSGDPVTINSVNQFLNTAFYRSNTPHSIDFPDVESTTVLTASTDGSIDLQYDGLTTVLTASAEGLILGETYDVSFLISDVGDSAYDSGVFIESGSVSFTGATPENPLLPPPPQPGGPADAPFVFPEIVNFDPDFVWWFDPDVAIGYTYNVANPNGLCSINTPLPPFPSTVSTSSLKVMMAASLMKSCWQPFFPILLMILLVRSPRLRSRESTLTTCLIPKTQQSSWRESALIPLAQ